MQAQEGFGIVGQFSSAFKEHCSRLSGVKKFYNMRISGMINQHKRERMDNMNKINHIRNSERNELLKELQLEKGDEFQNLVDYNTSDKCCQTEGMTSLTISLQFTKPKFRVYSKNIQARPVQTNDKIMQVNLLQSQPYIPSFRNMADLDKSFMSPSSMVYSPSPSIILEPFRLPGQRTNPEEDYVLEIIDDDDGDGSDQFDQLLNMSIDQLDKSPPSEVTSLHRKQSGANHLNPSQKKPPHLEIPSKLQTQFSGASGSKRLSRQASAASIQSNFNAGNRMVRIPSGVFDDRPNLMGRKSISLKGLKDIAQYFDEALQLKNNENLTKDKESLKLVIKKLDEFIEHNKRNLSQLDSEALLNKKRILEQVESRMIEFSEIQTKYYQAIFEKESAKRNNTDNIQNDGNLACQVNENKGKIDVGVIKKINNKNNLMISEANIILKKILIKNVNNEINKENTFSSKGTNLLNIISKVYKEYITMSAKANKLNKRFPSTPLVIYFYKFLSMKISNHSLVQKKYETILSSIIANDNSSAINLFGKFLGITGSYDHRCFEIFIETLQQFKKVAYDLINVENMICCKRETKRS